MEALAHANLLYWEGRLAECEAACRNLILIAPHSWEAYILWAQCRDLAKDACGRRRILRTCYTEADSLHSIGLNGCSDIIALARFYFQIRDIRQCRQWLRNAVELDPSNKEAIRIDKNCQRIQNCSAGLNDAISEMLLHERLELFRDDAVAANALVALLSRQKRLAPFAPAGNGGIANVSPNEIVLYLPDVLFHQEEQPVREIRLLYANLFRALQHSNSAFAVRRQPSYSPFIEQRHGCSHLTWHTHGRRGDQWHVKDGPLPRYFYLDASGYAGWAEIREWNDIDSRLKAISIATAEAFHDILHREYIEAGISKYEQPHGQPTFPERYIFLALQVFDDEVLTLSERDTNELIDLVLATFRNSPYTIVVKRHPLCWNDGVAARLASLIGVPNVLVTESSIHAIIPGAAAVFCINSGVGLEALLHLKHVFISGAADYEFGCHDLANFDCSESILALIESPVDELRLKKFLYVYFNQHLVDRNDEDAMLQRLATVLNDNFTDEI